MNLRTSSEVARLRYLFDTNVLSDLLRQPLGSLAARFRVLQGDEFCTSIVVACELRYGVVKRGSSKLLRKVEELLGQIDVVPLESDVEFHYAEIRAELERKGLPIGPNDLLIAAHCRFLGLTLVTRNVREFQRVPGLAIEDWSASR